MHPATGAADKLKNRGISPMGIRPRTDFVMKLKSRTCPKCGGKINSQKVRCKRCHEVQRRPKKKK
jgi:hypothetical protein